MENDRGLDDLFGELNSGDEPRPDDTVASGLPADPTDASALLNAAFIEAATAPVEPFPTDGGAPSDAADAGDPGSSERTDTGSAFPTPPLTRRQLRERRAQGEVTGAVPVPTPADEPFIPAFTPPAEVPAPAADAPAAAAGTDTPVEDDLAPVAFEPVPYEPAPFDPAPELGVTPEEPEPEESEPEALDAVELSDEPVAESQPDASFSEAETPLAGDSSLAALAQEPLPSATEEPLLVGAGVGAAAAASGGSLPSATAPRQQAGRGFPIRLEPATVRTRRSVRWLAWFIPLILVLGGIGAAGWWVWANYEDKVREILGWEIPNDYTGTGNGTEVVITILPGDFGDDIAITLHQAGVTKSFDAFHDLLLDLGKQGLEPTFQPGNYRLQQEMSAQSALDALLDPANRITNQVIIPEGANLPATLEILSRQSGIPLEELQAEAANFAQFGLPGNAVSLEGYLFPAAYQLDGTETAVTLLQRLVTEMFDRLDALGVAPEDRNRFLTLASIVQKESGPNPADPPKIARVFQNRIDSGMALESDATVTYGTCVWGPTQGRTPPDTCGTVWLNQADIDDTSNPYNTRALPGLPPGPIAMPGQAALDAVANPADGPWLFFVAVNLATGETVFSETWEEHEAAVDLLNAWCNSGDPEAISYCA